MVKAREKKNPIILGNQKEMLKILKNHRRKRNEPKT